MRGSGAGKKGGGGGGTLFKGDASELRRSRAESGGGASSDFLVGPTWIGEGGETISAKQWGQRKDRGCTGQEKCLVSVLRRRAARGLLGGGAQKPFFESQFLETQRNF